MTGIASFKYTPSALDSWGKAEGFFVPFSVSLASPNLLSLGKEKKNKLFFCFSLA